MFQYPVLSLKNGTEHTIEKVVVSRTIEVFKITSSHRCQIPTSHDTFPSDDAQCQFQIKQRVPNDDTEHIVQEQKGQQTGEIVHIRMPPELYYSYAR